MPVAIDKPSKYFNTVLYTGTGATRSITGVGFQPDWVWIKERSASASDHNLSDAIRGAGKALFSNTTGAEYDYGTGTGGNLRSFDSDGFSLGTASQTNANGTTFVSWCWDANGTGVSNTAGTISSTVSANTTSGFSICTLTTNAGGSGSYGHGLGVAPSFIIQKSRTNVTDWYVYHKSLGASAWLELNKSNGATTSNTAVWSGTAPSSTVVNLGSGWLNSNHGNVVAYCFAEVKGFSKAFSYTGNGSADGSFVYCGFLPSFVLFKRTDSAFGWYIYDTKRRTFNQNNVSLSPNASDAEDTASGAIDILSNGFKLRNSDGSKNASGGTYIGIAFAENPFVSSKGLPTTAR